MSLEIIEEQNQNNRAEGATKRVYELNLDPEYWRTKFLYPFALDPAPLRLDPSSKQTPEEVI